MTKSNLITLTELKQNLNTYDSRELIELICEISKTCPSAKEFLTLKFSDKNTLNEILESYKEKIKYEFFPKRGIGRLNLKEAKKAISDFKKISKNKADVLELMLYYVENGVKFTDEYGDINATFYNSIVSTFDNIVKSLNEEKDPNLYTKFSARLWEAANKSCDGWGFKDSMMEIYHDIYWVKEQ